MIAARHAPPAWGTFFEVGNATGFKTRRHADAVAIGIWPSQGHAVHGFEVKRSRSDWLHELKQPEKADAVMGFCDFWWLVAADKDVAKLSEVPPTWGLLVPRGDTLYALKDAPSLTPEPLSRSFIAAMLRRVSETTVPKARLDEVADERVKSHMARHRDRATREYDNLKAEYDRLAKTVAEFEVASGVTLNSYLPGARIGAAVKIVMNDSHEYDGLRRRFTNLRESIDAMRRDCDAHLALVNQAETEANEAQRLKETK
jgi:hypothetical protein